jgi:hypothetical protein
LVRRVTGGSADLEQGVSARWKRVVVTSGTSCSVRSEATAGAESPTGPEARAEAEASRYDTGASCYDTGASCYDTGASRYDTGASRDAPGHQRHSAEQRR